MAKKTAMEHHATLRPVLLNGGRRQRSMFIGYMCAPLMICGIKHLWLMFFLSCHRPFIEMCLHFSAALIYCLQEFDLPCCHRWCGQTQLATSAAPAGLPVSLWTLAGWLVPCRRRLRTEVYHRTVLENLARFRRSWQSSTFLWCQTAQFTMSSNSVNAAAVCFIFYSSERAWFSTDQYKWMSCSWNPIWNFFSVNGPRSAESAHFHSQWVLMRT